MLRAIIATSVALLTTVAVQGGAEPQPLWELDVSGGNRSIPGWLSYSPDGKAIVAVTIRETTGVLREYQYQLHVWDAQSRSTRFNADLGLSRNAQWGDELATFPTNATVMTGGQGQTTRSLEDGKQTSTQPVPGLAEYGVWAVPDLQESFFLRRDPGRHGLPVELLHRPQINLFDDYSFRGRGNNQNVHHTAIPAPREDLRVEGIALNPGRTHLVAAFRDETLERKPRHALVRYEIRTVEEFALAPVAEAANPHPGPISALAFARNGKILATGGEDGSVAVWDVNDKSTSWKPRAMVSGVADHRVRAIAFSPDWRTIAAVTWDRTKPNLLLIDVDDGKLIRAVRLERELSAVTFSLDGLTLLTGSGSGKIRAWDVAALRGD